MWSLSRGHTNNIVYAKLYFTHERPTFETVYLIPLPNIKLVEAKDHRFKFMKLGTGSQIAWETIPQFRGWINNCKNKVLKK